MKSVPPELKSYKEEFDFIHKKSVIWNGSGQPFISEKRLSCTVTSK